MRPESSYNFWHNNIDADALRPAKHQDPYRRLAAAVLVQAVRDAADVRQHQDQIDKARQLQTAGKRSIQIEKATGLRMAEVNRLEVLLDAEAFIRLWTGTDLWHRQLGIDTEEAQALADRALELDGAISCSALLCD